VTLDGRSRLPEGAGEKIRQIYFAARNKVLNDRLGDSASDLVGRQNLLEAFTLEGLIDFLNKVDMKGESAVDQSGLSLVQKLNFIAASGRDVRNINTIKGYEECMEINGGDDNIIYVAPTLSPQLSNFFVRKNLLDLAARVEGLLIAVDLKANSVYVQTLEIQITELTNTVAPEVIGKLITEVELSNLDPFVLDVLMSESDPARLEHWMKVAEIMRDRDPNVSQTDIIDAAFKDQIIDYTKLRDFERSKKEKWKQKAASAMKYAKAPTSDIKTYVNLPSISNVIPTMRQYAGSIYFFNPDVNSSITKAGTTKSIKTPQWTVLDARYPQGVRFNEYGIPNANTFGMRQVDGVVQIPGSKNGETIEVNLGDKTEMTELGIENKVDGLTDLELTPSSGYSQKEAAKNQRKVDRGSLRDQVNANLIMKKRYKENGWGNWKQPPGTVWFFEPGTNKAFLVDELAFNGLGFAPFSNRRMADFGTVPSISATAFKPPSSMDVPSLVAEYVKQFPEGEAEINNFLDNVTEIVWSPLVTARYSVRDSLEQVTSHNLAELYPQLTAAELLAIHHYSRGASYPFNAAKRNPIDMSEFFTTFDKLLQSGLDKLPNYEGRVYRGTSLPEHYILSKYKEAADNNTQVSEDAYTSCSKTDEVLEEYMNRSDHPKDVNVIFIIESKTGKDIEGISYFGKNFPDNDNHREVLYQPGVNYYVTKVKPIKNKKSELLYYIIFMSE
jgi:hypothetical protein